MRVLDDWLLTVSRLAIHLPTQTAVVADLHLGYARARRRRGDAVPEEDLTTALAPLTQELRNQSVQRFVVAGDLFESGKQVHLLRQLVAWSEQTGVVLVGVVPGNHDRGLSESADVPVYPDGVRLGSWLVVHGDGELPEEPLVQGHEHPSFRWGTVRAPCYLVGKDRLILPAYSSDAAGVNVVRDARWTDFRSVVIAGSQLLDFGILGNLTK